MYKYDKGKYSKTDGTDQTIGVNNSLVRSANVNSNENSTVSAASLTKSGSSNEFEFGPAMEQRILAAKDRQSMRQQARARKLSGGTEKIESQYLKQPDTQETYINRRGKEKKSKLYKHNLNVQERINKGLDKQNLKESKPYKPIRKDIKSAKEQVEEDRIAKIAKYLKEGGMGQAIRQGGADIGYIPGDVEMFDESMENDADVSFINKDLTAYNKRITDKKAKDKSIRQEIAKDTPELLQTSLMDDDDTDAGTSFAADDIKEGQRSRRAEAFQNANLKSKIGKIDEKGRSIDAIEIQRKARRAKGLGMGAMMPGKEFEPNLPPNAASAIATLFPTESQRTANKLASQKLMKKKMNSGLNTMLDQISKSK